MVRAAGLTRQAIVGALDRGDFYASTEITLAEYEVNDRELFIAIQPESDFKYTTLFIGKGGEILKRVHGNAAAYRFKGSELYVRAKVVSSNGGFVWTQPVFLSDLR